MNIVTIYFSKISLIDSETIKEVYISWSKYCTFCPITYFQVCKNSQLQNVAFRNLVQKQTASLFDTLKEIRALECSFNSAGKYPNQTPPSARQNLSRAERRKQKQFARLALLREINNSFVSSHFSVDLLGVVGIVNSVICKTNYTVPGHQNSTLNVFENKYVPTSRFWIMTMGLCLINISQILFSFYLKSAQQQHFKLRYVIRLNF